MKRHGISVVRAPVTLLPSADSLNLSQDLNLLTLGVQVVKVQVLPRTPHVAQPPGKGDRRLLEPIPLGDLTLDAPLFDIRRDRLADVELVRVRVRVLRLPEGEDPLGPERKVLSGVELFVVGLVLLLLLFGLFGLVLGLFGLGGFLFSVLLTLLELAKVRAASELQQDRDELKVCRCGTTSTDSRLGDHLPSNRVLVQVLGLSGSGSRHLACVSREVQRLIRGRSRSSLGGEDDRTCAEERG